MEDNLWWRTTFDGRRPLTEDDLWRKTTFDGRWPLMEDDLWRKTSFDGRRSMTEDYLWRKTQLRQRSDYCHPVAIFFYASNNFTVTYCYMCQILWLSLGWYTLCTVYTGWVTTVWNIYKWKENFLLNTKRTMLVTIVSTPIYNETNYFLTL